MEMISEMCFFFYSSCYINEIAGDFNNNVEFKYFSRHFVWRFSIAIKKINKNNKFFVTKFVLIGYINERRKRLGRTRRNL